MMFFIFLQSLDEASLIRLLLSLISSFLIFILKKDKIFSKLSCKDLLTFCKKIKLFDAYPFCKSNIEMYNSKLPISKPFISSRLNSFFGIVI